MINKYSKRLKGGKKKKTRRLKKNKRQTKRRINKRVKKKSKKSKKRNMGRGPSLSVGDKWNKDEYMEATEFTKNFNYSVKNMDVKSTPKIMMGNLIDELDNDNIFINDGYILRMFVHNAKKYTPKSIFTYKTCTNVSVSVKR